MQLLMPLHKQLLLLKNMLLYSRLTPTCRACHTVTVYALMTMQCKLTVPNAQLQASYHASTMQAPHALHHTDVWRCSPDIWQCKRGMQLDSHQLQQMAAECKTRSRKNSQHYGSYTGGMQHINHQAVTFHPRGDVIELYAHS